MSKYSGLADLLRHQPGPIVELAFHQIAAAVHGGLPPSAYTHREWWGNDTTGRHVQANAWMRVGWLVDGVDLDGRTVRFRPER